MRQSGLARSASRVGFSCLAGGEGGDSRGDAQDEDDEDEDFDEPFSLEGAMVILASFRGAIFDSEGR